MKNLEMYRGECLVLVGLQLVEPKLRALLERDVDVAEDGVFCLVSRHGGEGDWARLVAPGEFRRPGRR